MVFLSLLLCRWNIPTVGEDPQPGDAEEERVRPRTIGSSSSPPHPGFLVSEGPDEASARTRAWKHAENQMLPWSSAFPGK